MGRQLRRVPLDFHWPLNKVWQGYIMPVSMTLPTCTECNGDGYTVEARAIAHTFYPHQIDGPNADVLAWHDKIGQAEVDNLIAEGRLHTLKKREPTPENPREWEWVAVPLTADQVNACNRRGAPGFGGFSHDAINRGILIEFRCKQLGIPLSCPVCQGNGDIGTDEQREAVDNWEGTDPPSGEGWQMWETVSEGSPISPVFKTPEELAQYCADHPWGGGHSTYAQWLNMITGGEWAPSLIVDAAGVHDGVAGIAKASE